MTHEADLYTYLSTHADASALRALVTSRISWGQFPQGVTRPAIRIHERSGEPGMVLDGDNDRQTTLLQFSIVGDLHTDCIDIREELRSLLHGASRITSGTTIFESFRMIDTNEDWLDDVPGGYFYITATFRIFHTPT